MSLPDHAYAAVSSSSPLRVKICGVVDLAAANAARRAGADWIGLNFSPPSPRALDPPESAAEIVAALGHERVVGLFVNRPVPEIAAFAQRVGLRLIQLHGDETPKEAQLLASAGLQVIKAFRIGDAEAIAQARRWLDQAHALTQGQVPFACLFDAFVPGRFGGTGATLAASLLEGLRPMMASSALRPILAGGLTPENLAERLELCPARPWMVDVAGGVESAPGVKDPTRMAAFVAAARRFAASRFE